MKNEFTVYRLDNATGWIPLTNEPLSHSRATEIIYEDSQRLGISEKNYKIVPLVKVEKRREKA